MDETEQKVMLTVLQTLATINENIVQFGNNSLEALEQIEGRFTDIESALLRIENQLNMIGSDLSRGGDAIVELESTVSISVMSSLESISSDTASIYSTVDTIEGEVRK
jgi:archaellum component FlaC